ncbi:MAG: MBL fold metallo-hydrolase [Sphingobacteriia bacterium]|nr:MBL fold metallo-hydrolase [Sphingobacteriia bacterium]
MKITFWGAAQEVTGSMHLLETHSGKKILLDCGLYQGHAHGSETINREWPISPNEIDYVILSHAHIDHSGRLPGLVKEGYSGPIFSTAATLDLASIMLADSAHIQEKDTEYENIRRAKKKLPALDPLYTLEDIAPCINAFISIGYGKWFQISSEIAFIFQDAGHLLGSVSVTLRITETGKPPLLIGFSGDVGRPNTPILKDPVPLPPVDYFLCESTYGGKKHEQGPDADKELLKIVTETCVTQKGKLIIPAFSVGRTQEIIYALDKLSNAGLLPDIPVYVDSPLAINATDVFQLHPECFDTELSRYLQKDPNPFGFNRLHYIRDVAQSKALNELKGPCIIISASGMIEAGRIKHHIRNHITNSNNCILIVGYCTPYTIGGKLREGAKEIQIFGETYPVKAKIVVMDAYSAHADESELLSFLRLQNPSTVKKAFLVHGESESLTAFQNALFQKGYSSVIIPERGQSFELI